MFSQNPFCFDFPNNQWLNWLSSFQNEPKDDPRLLDSPYQAKYLQNYDLLKEELKLTVKNTISFVALNKYLYSPTEKW